MIKTLDNKYGSCFITISMNFKFICSVTKQVDKAVLTIEYNPELTILEIVSLKRYIKSLENREFITEELVNILFNDLKRLLTPSSLRVGVEIKQYYRFFKKIGSKLKVEKHGN